ncbi:MAG: TfoX/Sxy family protein, partial [Chloroflexota bacterium]
MTSTEKPLQDAIEGEINSWGAVDTRAMFGAQAYLVGGRMFAALGEMGLLVKLPESRRRPLLDQGDAQPFAPTGQASFGEWIALIPNRWQENIDGLLGLVKESFDYVQQQRPSAAPPREARRFRKCQF